MRTGSIGNYVWVDENSDGYQDAGEPGLPNIRIFLKNCSTGATLATTYTDAQGGYLFDNLAPGTYCVDVDETTLPAGMTQTPYNLPGADFGNQNHSGNGYQVVLPPGGENLTADFGYNYNTTPCVDGDPSCNDATATIGDRVWVDADGDGVQDPEEVGISGVLVTLFYDPDGDGVYSTPYPGGHRHDRRQRQLPVRQPAAWLVRGGGDAARRLHADGRSRLVGRSVHDVRQPDHHAGGPRPRRCVPERRLRLPAAGKPAQAASATRCGSTLDADGIGPDGNAWPGNDRASQASPA